MSDDTTRDAATVFTTSPLAATLTRKRKVSKFPLGTCSFSQFAAMFGAMPRSSAPSPPTTAPLS